MTECHSIYEPPHGPLQWFILVRDELLTSN